MAQKTGKFLQAGSYLVIGFALFCLIGISRNCGRIQSVIPEGNSGGDTLDIAILYAPESIYMYSDSLSGINYEIAKKFFSSEEKPYKIWPVADADDALKKLKSGSFNILASLPLDNDIKKEYPVSESVFLDRLVLIQNPGADKKMTIKSSLDLSGKTVYVASGSRAGQRLDNLANEIGGKIEIKEEPGLSDELLSLKVASGEIPFAVVNEKTARKVAESYPNLSYDNPVSFTQFQVWVFNPSDTILLGKFNGWLDSFKQTEDYNDILDDFTSVDYPSDDLTSE